MGTAAESTTYIAHLEMAMILLDLMLCIFLNVQKKEHTKLNRRYLHLVYILTAGTIIDVITCFILNHEAMVPMLVMRPMRALNGVFAALVCLALFRYMLAFLNINVTLVQRVAGYLPLVFVVALWALNPLTGAILTYREGASAIRGPLFMMVHYYLPLFYLLACIAVTFVYRKRVERMQMIAFIMNLVFVVALYLMQMLYIPYLMITYYVGSVAVYTMFFALETPAYDRLIRTMEELEGARATADMSAAQAVMASRSKSIFLTGMSEEIRTPITSIISSDEHILADTTDRKIRRYARDLKEASMHLLGIVDDILVYSKIEAGDEAITEDTYATRSFLETVTTESYNMVRKKGLQISVTAEMTLPTRLYGDLPHILQIVQNLVSNASKYTDHGAVDISVSMPQVEKDTGILEISVADTGSGIREEDMPILFDSFARVNLREHRTIAGTGLGLTITKRLTDLMHGEITVKSVPHRGSIFTVRIPQKIEDKMYMGSFDANALYDALERSAKALSEESGIAFRGCFRDKRILIIDDTTVNLTLMKNLLKDTGVIVDIGSDGETCLEMAAENDYDLIFIDQMMPVMDGVETFREITQRRERDAAFASKTAPVIAIVTEDTREVRRFLLAQGFAATLVKPVDADIFLDTVRKYLT